MNSPMEVVRVFAKENPNQEIQVAMRQDGNEWTVVAISGDEPEEVLYRSSSKAVARVWALRVPTEMYQARGYKPQGSTSVAEPLAIMADFSATQWPEVEKALKPLGLTKGKGSHVIYRGTASVAFRSVDGENVHAAGFFDPEGDLDGIAMAIAVARMVSGRITNQTGDPVDGEPLIGQMRARAHEIAEDIYGLAASVDVVPTRLNLARIVRPASEWAEVF